MRRQTLAAILAVAGWSSTQASEPATADSTVDLQEKTVVGRRTTRYAAPPSDQPARMPLARLENPQVVSVVTAETMEDRGVNSVAEALRLVAGGANPNQTFGSGGVGTNLSLRGFDTYSVLRDGMATNYVTQSDPAILDRIEVLKGPSGTLFGSTLVSYGGVVNRVTKQPSEERSGSLSYTFGDNDLSRLEVDFNTPLDSARTVLLRVNTARHREDPPADLGSGDSWVFSPALAWKASEDLTLSFRTELFSNRATAAYYNIAGSLSYKDLGYGALDPERSHGSDDLLTRSEVFNNFASAEWRIGGGWTSRTLLSNSYTKNDANYMFFAILTDSTLRRQVMHLDSRFQAAQLQQNLVGDHSFGDFRNRLLLGADFYHLDNTSTRTAALTYDVVNYKSGTWKPISAGKAEAMLDTASLSTYFRKSDTWSGYASDVLDWDGWIQAMASLRLDHYAYQGATGYEQDQLSPKLGLVVQPIRRRLSLFANWMNGFTNVAPGIDSLGNDVEFDPEQAWQWEVGAKLELWEGRLSATASWYDIEVEDVVRSLSAYTQVQDGTKESKGVELELAARPLEGLDLTANYAYNDCRIVKAASYEGKRPQGTPMNVASAWLRYSLQRGPLAGLGAGAGASYQGEMYLNDANTVAQVGYHTVDASLSFERKNYRVDLFAKNLGDERAWSGNYRYAPLPGRALSARLTYGI